jgi:hypothetical protein
MLAETVEATKKARTVDVQIYHLRFLANLLFGEADRLAAACDPASVLASDEIH